MMKKRSLLALILGFGLAAATLILVEGMPSARAAGPWYVSLAGDNSDCLSWATACTTIDGAHNKASSGDTINVAAGTYVENLYIGKDITLLGAGAGSTIVDGGNVGSTIRVYQYTSVTISGMTIRNGSGTLGTGGGILAERNATVQVSNATIYNNRATTDGGGMYLALNSVVTITNSTIISNTAGTDGGGIYGDDPNGTLTIIDSTISENAAGRDGGGVYQNAGTLTIEGSDIISNTAQDNAGGIRKSYGSMSIGTTLIANNTAVDWGGGIYGTDSTVMIDDSTIRDNQVTAASSYGGGIFSSADMTLTNVTVSGNASPNGGGIVHTNASYTMTLRNCTVVGNTTGGGGGPAGMRLYSWVTMENTIIANNETTNCGIGSGGNLTSLGYNLESANSCGLNATGDITDTNPLIGPLQNNGGTTVGTGEATLTHALLPKSPAINAGDPAFSTPPDTDQRGIGFPRVLYGRVDIGAYEVTLILDQHVYLPLVLRDN